MINKITIIFVFICHLFGENKTLYLDGDWDYARIPYNESYRPIEAVTLECWFKLTEPVYSQTPFRLVNVTHAGGYGFIFNINDNKLQFLVHINGDYQRVALESEVTSSLPTNQWLHIAGTYDGKFLKIYLGGNLMDTLPVTGNIHYAYNNAMLFGVEAGAGNYPDPYLEYFFNGWLDEIRIWDYGRSTLEIQTDMYNIPSGDEGGLVAYWNFNDGSMTDSSPFNNHGILIGNAVITGGNDLEICSLLGDVNFDYTINILDLVDIINFILYGGNINFFLNCADFNNDGAINILDVAAVSEIIIFN